MSNEMLKNAHAYFINNPFCGTLLPLEWIDLWKLSCKPLKSENGYLISKLQIIKWAHKDAIYKALRISQKTGWPRASKGKWVNKANLEYAGQQASTLKPREMNYFPINADHKSIVFNPDGTIDIPNMIRVRNNRDGIFHGFPINSNTTEPIY